MAALARDCKARVACGLRLRELAGAIYRMTVNVSFVPSVALAPGVRKCFLNKWDAWGSSVAEAREDDNEPLPDRVDSFTMLPSSRVCCS